MSDILRRIAALMAKANGTENEHEAAAFAAKAHAMLAEHNFTIEDAIRYGAKQGGEEVGQAEYVNKQANGWRHVLLGAVCDYYFCRLIISRNRGGHDAYLVIGKPTNTTVALSMFAYLENATKRLSREWHKANGATKGEKEQFKKGCGLRIAERLRAAKAEQMAQAAKSDAAAPKTGLPALYNSEALAIRNFVEAKLGKLGKGRPISGAVRGAGGAAGRAAAEGVSLNTQVGQQRNALQLD